MNSQFPQIDEELQEQIRKTGMILLGDKKGHILFSTDPSSFDVDFKTSRITIPHWLGASKGYGLAWLARGIAMIKYMDRHVDSYGLPMLPRYLFEILEIHRAETTLLNTYKGLEPYIHKYVTDNLMTDDVVSVPWLRMIRLCDLWLRSKSKPAAPPDLKSHFDRKILPILCHPSINSSDSLRKAKRIAIEFGPLVEDPRCWAFLTCCIAIPRTDLWSDSEVFWRYEGHDDQQRLAAEYISEIHSAEFESRQIRRAIAKAQSRKRHAAEKGFIEKWLNCDKEVVTIFNNELIRESARDFSKLESSQWLDLKENPGPESLHQRRKDYILGRVREKIDAAIGGNESRIYSAMQPWVEEMTKMLPPNKEASDPNKVIASFFRNLVHPMTQYSVTAFADIRVDAPSNTNERTGFVGYAATTTTDCIRPRVANQINYENVWLRNILLIEQLSALLRKHMIIRSEKRCRVRGLKYGNRIDSRSLHRIAVGGNDLFMSDRRIMSSTCKAFSCSVLIDESGSMQDYIHTSTRLAVVLGEVLHALKCDFEVLGYSSSSFDKSEVREFKRFDEEYATVKATIGAIQATESNDDAAAIREAGKRLLEREFPPKAILVITDGEFVSRDSDIERSIRDLKNEGVVTVCLLVDPTKRLAKIRSYGFEHVVRSKDPRELLGLFKELARSL